MDQQVIAVDPGREKCGVAVVERQGRVLYQKVIDTPSLTTVLTELANKFATYTVIIGDRTSSRETRQRLEQISINGQRLTIHTIDEHRSTDQARRRYWRENPPKGLKRLIPTTMQVPPVPVDDYVAVILAERYFSKE